MVKKIVKTTAYLGITLIILLLTSHTIISHNSKGKTYTNINKIPKNKVGLVLGTASKTIHGNANPYYTHRVKATAALYHANKIEYILVSGDNGTKYYNEPATFKKDLIKAGVPEKVIFLDYAGFRTLDSMMRAKTVFGLDQVTLISQQFHNERAIYIAEHKKLKAIGFNATDVSVGQGAKVQLREYFARVKVFIDLLLNTQPKFYGDKIEIKG